MTSTTISPSIDQAAKEIFQTNFYKLAQQSKSRLMASNIIRFLPSGGKTNHMARMGRLELTEVELRNPDKQYGDYSLDNRQFTKRRFTRTIQIDAKHDINELIKDPSSDIMEELNKAKERVIDRIAVAAAVGPVLTGAPDTSPTSTSAASDGVLTVDASAGLTYEKVQEITQNFINNDLEYSQFSGSLFAITGSENTDLMAEAEFINNDYISGRPVEKGVQMNAGTYRIEMFAGSVNGGITVTNPVLPEGATLRSCVVMAPESIAMAMEVGVQDIQKSAVKVNSWDITIDLWINAMRTEGAKVQIVSTTI